MKPVLGSQLNYGHPLARGLVGCWLMNEGGGTKVFDLSGNGITGAITGAIWDDGNLQFDGTDDKVTSSKDVGGWSEISIITKVTTLEQVDGGWVNINNIGAGDIYTGLRWDATDRCTANIGDGTNSYYGVSSNGSIPLNTPVHVAMTGVAGSYPSLYINGKYDFTASGSSGPPVACSTGPLYIGAGAKGYAKCKIEYVFLYNCTLTASEIAWLYCKPFAMFERVPIELWSAATQAVASTNLPEIFHHYRQCRS